MYRLFTAGVVLLWVSAMTALFVRDVWPAWSAQDAPPLNRQQLADLPQRQEQFGIFKAGDERIGTAWSDLQATPERTTIRGTIATDAQGIIPALWIESVTEFDSAGGLDSFTLRVLGIAHTRIIVRGERRGIYFPVEMHFGTFHRQANLDMSATRLIGDAMRPFTFLPALHVGQSWRMQVLDPIAAVLGGKTQFRPVVARVTRQETLIHLGQPVDCFVVETSPQQATAWVDAHGRVLVSKVDLPGFGSLQTREEPYDEKLRNQTKRRVRDSRSEEP